MHRQILLLIGPLCHREAYNTWCFITLYAYTQAWNVKQAWNTYLLAVKCATRNALQWWRYADVKCKLCVLYLKVKRDTWTWNDKFWANEIHDCEVIEKRPTQKRYLQELWMLQNQINFKESFFDSQVYRNSTFCADNDTEFIEDFNLLTLLDSSFFESYHNVFPYLGTNLYIC